MKIVSLRLQIAPLNLVESPTFCTACAKFNATGRLYHSMYMVESDLDTFNAAWDSSRVVCVHLELHVAKPVVGEEWRPDIGNL